VADISSTVAIPPTLPVCSVIWRSEQYSLDVKCWQDAPAHMEWVYLYLNISDPNQSQLGGQIEIGLNYKGQDYLCSAPGMQSGSYCKMALDVFFQGCTQTQGCADKSRIIHADFNFFIAKKKDGKPGQEGPLPNLPPIYPAVQFNGENGVNNLPGGRNFTVALTGLSKLRYVGCSSTIDVSPRTIDFGHIGSFSAKKGATIQDRPILITAVKACNSAYGLEGSFMPVSGSLTDANKTLVPVNNKSVGIQLFNTDDGKSIEFKKEFPLAPLGNRDRYVEKNIMVRLLWNADTAVLGDFNASAKLEIYYK